MDNNSPGGRGSLPRISSADFIARDVEVEAGASRGPVDMWTWNVAHWRRVCAQEALLRDDRATASQTYVDGRPKRRAREPRVQDMGFRNPDSAPNVFTLKEWRALGGAGSEATSILLTDQQVLPPSQLSEVQSDSEVDRDVPLETGLLDPVLFDQSGQLLQGERLQAALGTLCAVEKVGGSRPQQMAPSGWTGPDVSCAQHQHPLADDLLCRDDWDWQVRPTWAQNYRSAATRLFS